MFLGRDEMPFDFLAPVPRFLELGAAAEIASQRNYRVKVSNLFSPLNPKGDFSRQTAEMANLAKHRIRLSGPVACS